MLLTLVIFGCLTGLAVPKSDCGPTEYAASAGLCCPRCNTGTVVIRDCTPQSGTRCSPCKTGTFMNQPNGLKSCFSCTSCDKSHGLFAQQECTGSRDALCDVLEGYFCRSWADDSGCSSADKHTRCVPGQRVKEAGTSRNDTVCEVCQPGSFSQDGVDCTAWTVCPETQVKVKEGSTSSDVVCRSSSRNYYAYIPLLLSLLTVAGLVTTGRLTMKKDSGSPPNSQEVKVAAVSSREEVGAVS
ncbi:LOW QUALITY PROTEIN: tumor necrosis factor receptor superfamily member 14-like [Dicentrarchus labrax]|uniref:LOW QUALITY PROTEIN: tumor necrosis factor receptor superfamily member 14-like n=1 Tax=Dicentrarchus labrax TaxID=13489 RepID=UPI0021F57CC3|nr:LOW QUALITY PROTEIN: tumor necrosis factor receptor superfamily member 14-like [Dicentrarchus labrax]